MGQSLDNLNHPMIKNRCGDKYNPVSRVGIWKLPEERKHCVRHNTSNIIGTNSIQIQVIGTQDNKLQLWIFRYTEVRSIIHRLKTILLGGC